MAGRRAPRPFAALALAVLALALWGTGTASAADPVVTSIWNARKAGQLDPAKAAEYEGVWRESGRTARSLARRKMTGRAREVNGSRAIATDIAKRGQLNADRMPGVLASVRATSYVMRKRSFPKYEERVRIPDEPLVFAYFTGKGVQFHPLATFAWGNTLYSTGQTGELQRLADRLIEVGVTRGSFETWEYSFPYEHGRPPWISGMAQAVGAQVMARAWETTKDPRYLAAGQAAIGAFVVPGTQGGVTAAEGTGRWYLLYGYNSKQRVLNGHLQALLSLNEFHKLTGDENAKLRFDEGLAAVLPMLSRFDTGAWSMYDLSHEADLNYHDLMTEQLSRLGNRRQIVQFQDMAARFAAYRNTPPVINVPEQVLLPIRPFKDGKRDRTQMRFFVDKRSRVTVQVTSASGDVVRTLRADGQRGMRKVWWDGRNDRGRVVAPGAYTVAIVARDVVGNVREGNLTTPVLVQKDMAHAAGKRRR